MDEIKLNLDILNERKQNLIENGNGGFYYIPEIIGKLILLDEDLTVEIWKQLIEEFKELILVNEKIYKNIIQNTASAIYSKIGCENYVRLLNKNKSLKKMVYSFSCFSYDSIFDSNLVGHIYLFTIENQNEFVDEIMQIIIETLDKQKLCFFFSRLSEYKTQKISLSTIHRWIMFIEDQAIKNYIEILFEVSPKKTVKSIEQAQKIIEVFSELDNRKILTDSELSKLFAYIIEYNSNLAQNFFEQYISIDENNNIYTLTMQSRIKHYLNILFKPINWWDKNWWNKNSSYINNMFEMIRNSELIIKLIYQFTFIQWNQLDLLIKILDINDETLFKKCFECIKKNVIVNSDKSKYENIKPKNVTSTFSIEEIINKIKTNANNTSKEIITIMDNNEDDIVGKAKVLYTDLTKFSEIKDSDLKKLEGYFEKIIFLGDCEKLITDIFFYLLEKHIDYAKRCLIYMKNEQMKNENNGIITYYYNLIIHQLSKDKYKEQLYYICKNESLIYNIAIKENSLLCSIFEQSYITKDFEMANDVFNKISNKQLKLSVLEKAICENLFEIFSEDEKKYLFEWIELIQIKLRRNIVIGCLINSNMYEQSDKKSIAIETINQIIPWAKNSKGHIIIALIELIYYISSFDFKLAMQYINELKINKSFMFHLSRDSRFKNTSLLDNFINEDDESL